MRNRFTRATGWCASVAFALLSGCTTSSEPTVACTNVALDISADGTQSPNPTLAFRWAPACGVAKVVVMEGSTVRWTLEAKSAQGIPSGITYPNVPGSAESTVGPVALYGTGDITILLYNSENIATGIGHFRF